MFKHFACQNFTYLDAAGVVSVVSLDVYLGEYHHVVICTDRKTAASAEWTASCVARFFELDWARLIWIDREERPIAVGGVLRLIASYDLVTFQIEPSTREIRDATWRPMLAGDWMELGVPSPSDFLE